MSSAKFKTMRHIETVRNYLQECIVHLLEKARDHDQSKLQSPEEEIFEIYTPKLRDCVYGSEEYKQNMKEMKVAIDHHNEHNDHHPEHWPNGIQDMTLLDLLELVCDWKAATLRHATGDIMTSLELNQARFGYSDELKAILKNTATWLNGQNVKHHANES